jgi:hypothetical protein
MENQTKNEVVNNVTTKKKYVKPDCVVYKLNFEAPLLSASNQQNGVSGTATQYRTLSNGGWDN